MLHSFIYCLIFRGTLCVSDEIRLDYYPADQLHGLYVCVAAPRSSCADLLLPSVLFIFHMALGN